MKGKLLVILSGVVLLHVFVIGGLALAGGCSSDDEVAADPYYVPAPAPDSDSDSSVPVAPVTQPVTEMPNFVPSEPVTPSVALPVTPKLENVKYSVQKGDSLWKIAKMYGVSVNELSAYNQMSSAKSLKVGQVLTIPPGGRIVEKGEKLEYGKHLEKKTSKTSSKVSSSHSSKKAPAELPADGTYAVQIGDSLWKIAKKFNVKSADIAAANNMDVSKSLKIGQKLVIPKASSKSSTDTAVSKKADDTKKKDEVKVPSEVVAPASTPSTPSTPPKPVDSLLEEITAPDDSVSSAPLASPAAVESVASAATSSHASTASDEMSSTAEVGPDTPTISALASKYGCKAEDIMKLNPEIPADGNLKTGMVIKLP